MRVDVDGSHDNFLILGNDIRDVADDTDVVVADNMEGRAVLRRTFSAPARFHNAVAEPLAHLGRIGTVGTVNLDAAADGYKSEDGVAIDRSAASRQ